MPIFLPNTTFNILFGSSIPNTINGILLSIHKDVAVESIIPSPKLSISIYLNVSNLLALLFIFGSESYTPSTPFFPNNITSASISAALKAAVVSVEKYGLPVPAPNITTLPFLNVL